VKHTIATASVIADRFLTSGATVLEIGAGDGAHTRVYAERVGPTGHVLAVEPHRQSARAVQRVCEDLPWVTVLPVAVGARVGWARLQASRDHPHWSSLWAENVPDPGEAYPVDVTTIDVLVRALPRAPTVIQVDAQGAEAAILRGATTTLTLPIVWVIEVWATGLRRAGSTVRDVCEPFHACGYTPRSLLGTRLDWDEAEAYAAGRQQTAHADFVMVPEDLMEADW
jgi:FkbM family methyltransferase